MADAFSRRDVTQSFGLWKEEFIWRSAYFTIAVWACILLTHAPDGHFIEEKSD